MTKITNRDFDRIQYLAGYLNELADLIREQADAAIDTWELRTERWQESDRGQAFEDWQDQLSRIADDVQAAADSAGELEQSPGQA